MPVGLYPCIYRKQKETRLVNKIESYRECLGRGPDVVLAGGLRSCLGQFDGLGRRQVCRGCGGGGRDGGGIPSQAFLRVPGSRTRGSFHEGQDGGFPPDRADPPGARSLGSFRLERRTLSRRRPGRDRIRSFQSSGRGGGFAAARFEAAAMRLTEAQARKMGLKLAPAPSKARAGGRSAKGRDRAPRTAQPGDAVEFRVALATDPRPKERPRTVASMDALRAAFLASRGSLEAFMRHAADRISRTYTPKSTADYEKVVAEASTAAMGVREPFACAVETTITLVLAGDPESWPTSRLDGDADNLEKAVLDAMNGIVFADDRLVVRSYREKKCGPRPEILVRVEPARP